MCHTRRRNIRSRIEPMGVLVMKKTEFLLALLILLPLAGCTRIGGPAIVRDRFDYSVAISESWKSQMLLNIVKIRYSDTPVFMDVTSVINLVGFQNTLNLAAGWSFPPNANTQAVGGTSTWGEKPTITYAPLTGDKFTRSLLTPITPYGLLSMVQAGWPVRILFTLCVKSINDMDNQSSAPGFARLQDPQFRRLIELLEKSQKAGAVGTRIERKDKQDTAIVVFRRKKDRETEQRMLEIRQMLGLKPGTEEFKVIYGAAPTQEGEIAILTSSIMDIIIELASQIDVPPEHAAEGRTYATSRDIGEGEGQVPPLIRVFTGKEKPADSFVAINNRDTWFWIDDRDRKSKTIFTFLMILLSLAETGPAPQGPTVTVPIS
ncbi:MAG: hypothetical protein A4E72_01354 [Syntrophus sp. PtaU1.Bin208]|nr:MAG: hypothetical protein A4E72_01354 [Syntrophus sp. PtaU1.Bin208]